MPRIFRRIVCLLSFLPLVACAPTSSSSLGEYRTTHDGPQSALGVSLDASLDRPAFGPGDPIVLHVRAVNAGTKVAQFPHLLGQEFLFLVVTDSEGRHVGKTAVGLRHYPDSDFSVGSPAIQHLALGATTVFNIPVSEYYAFTRPGPYTISAYAPVSVDGANGQTVISNVVSFTIR